MSFHCLRIADYKGSRDYARLAELAKTKSVICIVDWRECRDVAHTLYLNGGDMETWQVGARGTCYVSAMDLGNFIARCAAVNLEFIEPPESSPDTVEVEAA